MKEIEYEVYKEELPKYMAGYGGHKSLDKKPKKVYKIIPNKYIPGYMGFVPSIKSENKFGESYEKETSESILVKSLGKQKFPLMQDMLQYQGIILLIKAE